MLNIVNLTPHAVVLRDSTGTDHTYPSAGVARVEDVVEDARPIAGLPVPVRAPAKPGPVSGLPAPSEGTAYIVSAIVLAHPDVYGRHDVFAPATGPTDGVIRGTEPHNKGHILAVTRLVGVAGA